MKLYCETCEKKLDFLEWTFEPPEDEEDLYSGIIKCNYCGDSLIV